GVQAHTRARARGARRARDRHARTRRARRPRAPAPLPPREARGRGRRGGVRRRHRHDLARRRPLRHPRSSRARAPRLARRPVAPPAEAGSREVQVVRTVPERVYGFLPRGDFRILESYIRALRSAQRLVYLENQFLWSPEVVSILADKLRDPPTDDFRVVVLLPSKANNGQDDTRGQLGVLVEADGDSRRFLAATITARTGTTTERIYVHAKVGIVDDRWLTLGSANLNAHSFFNDTEVNLVTCDPDLARRTRLALWAEHLEREESVVDGNPAAVV